MVNTPNYNSDEESRKFSGLVPGNNSEEPIFERIDGSFKGNRLVIEEDKNGNPKLDENGNAIHYWYSNGVMVTKEDLLENYELIDEMPIGMRNVMLDGNEIEAYKDWKRKKLEKEKSRKKNQGVMALRSLVGNVTSNKTSPTLDEWLGNQEGTPDPGHTETDDESDWGDIG